MFSRRHLLLAAAAACGVGLAGCDQDRPAPNQQSAPPPTASPSSESPIASDDDALRAAQAQSEADLITAYQLAIATHPELADEFLPMLSAHEEHRSRLLPGADPVPSPVPSDSQSPAKPESVKRIRAELADLEQTASRSRLTGADMALSGELAGLLCLICASEAQHAQVLKTQGQA